MAAVIQPEIVPVLMVTGSHQTSRLLRPLQRAEANEEANKQAAKNMAAEGQKSGSSAASKKEEGRRKRKGRHQQILEEWEDLATEERL